MPITTYCLLRKSLSAADTKRLNADSPSVRSGPTEFTPNLRIKICVRPLSVRLSIWDPIVHFAPGMSSIPTANDMAAVNNVIDGPPSKKLKSSAAAPQEPAAGVAGGYSLEPDIVTEAVMTAAPSLHEQYQAAEPYQHCVMHDVFNSNLLSQVRDEIINNINATYKETDLFKVFQTGAPPNLSDTAACSCPESLAAYTSLMHL